MRGAARRPPRPRERGSRDEAVYLQEKRQDFSANFWNVWQFSGTCPRLPANVHVTSLT